MALNCWFPQSATNNKITDLKKKQKKKTPTLCMTSLVAVTQAVAVASVLQANVICVPLCSHSLLLWRGSLARNQPRLAVVVHFHLIHHIKTDNQKVITVA